MLLNFDTQEKQLLENEIYNYFFYSLSPQKINEISNEIDDIINNTYKDLHIRKNIFSLIINFLNFARNYKNDLVFEKEFRVGQYGDNFMFYQSLSISNEEATTITKWLDEIYSKNRSELNSLSKNFKPSSYILNNLSKKDTSQNRCRKFKRSTCDLLLNQDDILYKLFLENKNTVILKIIIKITLKPFVNV